MTNEEKEYFINNLNELMIGISNYEVIMIDCSNNYGFVAQYDEGEGWTIWRSDRSWWRRRIHNTARTMIDYIANDIDDATIQCMYIGAVGR